jgi:hypothetical protein
MSHPSRLVIQAINIEVRSKPSCARLWFILTCSNRFSIRRIGACSYFGPSTSFLWFEYDHAFRFSLVFNIPNSVKKRGAIRK